METIYILLEKPPKGANHARLVEGRAAAKNWDKLRVFAQQLNARPLDDFFGAEPGKEAWFPPGEALTTLKRLIPSIASDKRGVDNIRHLIRDLNNFENILSSAEARGSKFRFSVLRDEDEVTV